MDITGRGSANEIEKKNSTLVPRRHYYPLTARIT